jgi:hypothetical protein
MKSKKFAVPPIVMNPVLHCRIGLTKIGTAAKVV